MSQQGYYCDRENVFDKYFSQCIAPYYMGTEASLSVRNGGVIFSTISMFLCTLQFWYIYFVYLVTGIQWSKQVSRFADMVRIVRSYWSHDESIRTFCSYRDCDDQFSTLVCRSLHDYDGCCAGEHCSRGYGYYAGCVYSDQYIGVVPAGVYDYGDYVHNYLNGTLIPWRNYDEYGFEFDETDVLPYGFCYLNLFKRSFAFKLYEQNDLPLTLMKRDYDVISKLVTADDFSTTVRFKIDCRCVHIILNDSYARDGYNTVSSVVLWQQLVKLFANPVTAWEWDSSQECFVAGSYLQPANYNLVTSSVDASKLFMFREQFSLNSKRITQLVNWLASVRNTTRDYDVVDTTFAIERLLIDLANAFMLDRLLRNDDFDQKMNELLSSLSYALAKDKDVLLEVLEYSDAFRWCIDINRTRFALFMGSAV